MYHDMNCPDCLFCCDDTCFCTGITGPTGPTGARGAQGPTGPTGPQGERGATGSQGLRGIAGAQGPQGMEGPRGAQGRMGAEGPQGEMGNTGPQGEIGPTGPKGERGIAGPQGPQGIEGPRGPQGQMGPEGPRGEQGETGPEGLPGIPGIQGERGPTGATGMQGPPGETGPTGPRGGILAQSFAACSTVGGSYPNATQLPLTPYITDENQDIVFTSATTVDVTAGYYYISYEVSGLINPPGNILVIPVYNDQPNAAHNAYDNATSANANVQAIRTFILYAAAPTRFYLYFTTSSQRITDAECHMVIVKLIHP